MNTCNVSWLSTYVLEFVYRDKVTIEDLNELVITTAELTASRTPRVQLVDTLGVTGVPAEIGAILNQLLDDYRSKGGSLVVMIANEKLNEMLGRSMSFGSGVQLQLFDNRPEALAFLSAYATE